MAWDMSFDHTWNQRIEKEERAYLRGEMEKKAKQKEERRRLRREMASSASCSELSYSSSRLSAAGSQALMGHSASASALGSEANGSSAMSPSKSRRHKSSKKKGGLAPGEIPEHLQAVVKFPVDVKDLLTVRVKEDEFGRIPKIRMQPEKVKAMWWPGKGTFTRYNPQFCFEEAPEWTPAHILKGPPGKY